MCASSTWCCIKITQEMFWSATIDKHQSALKLWWVCNILVHFSGTFYRHSSRGCAILLDILAVSLIRCLFQHRFDDSRDVHQQSRSDSNPLRRCAPWTDELKTDVCRVKIESTVPVTSPCLWFNREKRCFRCKQEAHEAGKRDEREREREKLMHGIGDPLTKLSLAIAAGGINTEASVRAGKQRQEEEEGLTRRTRLCKWSHVRRLLNGAFNGKTRSQEPVILRTAGGK